MKALLTLLFIIPVFTKDPPNILMILVDDLKPTNGAYGDPHAITPHLDSLAQKGHPLCPPSKPQGKLTREEAMFQNVPAPPGGMNSLPRGAAYQSPDVPDNAYADGRVASETIKRLKAAKARSCRSPRQGSSPLEFKNAHRCLRSGLGKTVFFPLNER